MDLDHEIQYMGRSALRGISLEPTEELYKKRDFFFSGSNVSLEVSLGRLPSSGPIQINDSAALYRCAVVSRKHAQLTLNRSTNKVTIQDLSSHHGTFVRSSLNYPTTTISVSTTMPTTLFDGDIITLGKSVTDVHGGVVHPVSFTVKFHYQSSPTKAQSSNKFGLSCLSDSSDSEDEGGPEREGRASSMDISPHSSSEKLPLSHPSPLTAVAFLEIVRPHTPEPSSRFDSRSPSPLAEGDIVFNDQSELPHNQLGLESDGQFPLNSSDDARSSPVETQSEQPEEDPQPQEKARSVSHCSFSFSPCVYENHAASIHSIPFSVPPIAGVEERMVSSGPLDLHPVTPPRTIDRGREQSPISPVRQDDELNQDAPMSPPPVADPQSPLPKPVDSDNDNRGIRAFFKAIGVVRSPPPAGDTSIYKIDEAPIEKPSLSSAPLQEEIPDELRNSLHDYIQEELGRQRDIQDAEMKEILSTTISSRVESVESDLRKQLDDVQQNLDHLRSERDDEHVALLDHLKSIDAEVDATSLNRDLAHSDLEKKFDTLHQDVTDALNHRIEPLGDKLDALQNRLSTAEGLSAGLSHRVNEAEERLDDLSVPSVDPLYVKSLLDDMKTAMTAEFAEREEKMMSEIQESKMLVQQVMESRKGDAMVVCESSKRPLEDEETDRPSSKRSRRRSRRFDTKSFASNVAKGVLLTTLGGIGAWLGLAYL